jgi:hypothetical protein
VNGELGAPLRGHVDWSFRIDLFDGSGVVAYRSTTQHLAQDRDNTLVWIRGPRRFKLTGPGKAGEISLILLRLPLPDIVARRYQLFLTPIIYSVICL